MQARHVEEADDKAGELLEVFLAAELGVEQHDQVAGVGLGWPRLHHGLYHSPHAGLHSTKACDHFLLNSFVKMENISFFAEYDIEITRQRRM